MSRCQPKRGHHLLPLAETFAGTHSCNQRCCDQQPNTAKLLLSLGAIQCSPKNVCQGGGIPYKVNNASIVVLIEIQGLRFLFTGDANGKERDELSPGTPGHVEAKQLALEQAQPGLLKVDVLKVPHHGSETASTQEFTDAVDFGFAIISASTKHHLPKPTVETRYQDGQRVVLRTDIHPENDIDHVLCMITQTGGRSNAFDCIFATALNE